MNTSLVLARFFQPKELKLVLAEMIYVGWVNSQYSGLRIVECNLMCCS
jgi:hypothetical protein